MPTFPLYQGTKTTKGARYLDAMPVNLVPTPHSTESDQVYLRSFPGVRLDKMVDGISFGAEWNDTTQEEFRILGGRISINGEYVHEMEMSQLTNVCHSKKSFAYVDNEKLKFWSEGKSYELKNWAQGEYSVSYPDWIFTVEFNGNQYVSFPRWESSGSVVVNCSVFYSLLPSDDQFIIGSAKAGGEYCGVFYKALDKSFYYRLDASKEVKIQAAKQGENILSFQTEDAFSYPLECIGAVRVGDSRTFHTVGQIYNLTILDTSDVSTFRDYTLLLEVETEEDGSRPKEQTSRIVKNENDPTGATDGRMYADWVDYHEQGEPTLSDATEYDLSGVIDVDRHQGRFVWINKDLFGCTALSAGVNGTLEDPAETRPEYRVPFYSPESDPDDNKAILSWKGHFVAVFGRNTTQFFSLTGNADALYAPQKGMETQAGIVGTHAVCKYMDNFAALGGTKGGTLQVMIITASSHQKISDATVDQIIQKYKESELSDVLLETVMHLNHQFLFVHLPNEVLVYDGAQNTWIVIKDGFLKDEVYPCRHFIFNPEKGITCGDKKLSRIGILDDSVAGVYGKRAEHICYTPFVQVNRGGGKIPLYNLTFNSIFGESSKAQAIMISMTVDGRHYPNEVYLPFNEPQRYVNEPIIRQLGSVDKSVGFKLRVDSGEPVTLSSFSVEVGNGG